MRPVLFPEANKVLEKPPGFTDEQCGDLEVFTDGNCCVSCWELNKEELEMINKTGRVYALIITGTGTQPPMSLHIEPPFINPYNG